LPLIFYRADCRTGGRTGEDHATAGTQQALNKITQLDAFEKILSKEVKVRELKEKEVRQNLGTL